MKNCLECGDSFSGREDKKFCGDGCRNSYNNKINKDNTNLMRNINNRLRKNYRILSELNPNEKSKTTRNQLIAKNFDFDFFTSVHQTDNGDMYYFLYDQGYRPVENDGFVLVKKDKNLFDYDTILSRRGLQRDS